jgi:hypothetical protein
MGMSGNYDGLVVGILNISQIHSCEPMCQQ